MNVVDGGTNFDGMHVHQLPTQAAEERQRLKRQILAAVDDQVHPTRSLTPLPNVLYPKWLILHQESTRPDHIHQIRQQSIGQLDESSATHGLRSGPRRRGAH